MRLIDADSLISLVTNSTILGKGFVQAFVAIVNGEPTVQPEPHTDALKAEIKRMKRSFTICINPDYYKGYMSALSAVEGYIAQMEVTE